MPTTTAAPAARSTAEATPARKRRDGGPRSGGQPVARAPLAAGPGTIVTPGSSHGSARRG